MLINVGRCPICKSEIYASRLGMDEILYSCICRYRAAIEFVSIKDSIQNYVKLLLKEVELTRNGENS